MKPHLFLSGALFLSVPAFAQAPTNPTTQEVNTMSGYDLLVQAGKTILPGPNGGASSAEKLPPEENLKNERLAVARNAPALALVRQALQKPIEMPEPQLVEKDFEFYARTRELARQFLQESDVRIADGDYMGAITSRLDTIEMGAVVGHGILTSLLVGEAIETIALKGFDKIAAHLDANQCRQVMARLEKIEARRPTVAETLRAEQKYTLNDALKNLPQLQEETAGKLTEGYGFNAKDIAAFRALTRDKLTINHTRLYTAAIASTALPFSQAKAAPYPQDLDPYTKISLGLLQSGFYRFLNDYIVTQIRLFSTALELRAIKLETGKYPGTIKTPFDPFAAKETALGYRQFGDEYLIYSVGPNGKDENGAKIQTPIPQEGGGNRIVNDRVLPDSTGDIVQNPL